MTNKVELNSNEEALEEAGRITYSRAERQAMGSGEAADDHPYYYDMESKSQVARVNAWLRGTAKRLTINPNDVYQEIKQKLVLLGIVLPNYQITPEDEGEGEIAFEAEWYPGYRETEEGGMERTSSSAENIPGGLWLIMNIRMEDGRYSLDMKLVAGSDYFEDEELDNFDDMQNDEADFEDDAMSEAYIEEAADLPVKKIKDIKDSSLEKEAKKLIDNVKKSKDKNSVVVFTDFGGQKNVEIMNKDDATYKKMAKEKFGFIVESPKI